jgi:hypothetical protein
MFTLPKRYNSLSDIAKDPLGALGNAAKWALPLAAGLPGGISSLPKLITNPSLISKWSLGNAVNFFGFPESVGLSGGQDKDGKGGTDGKGGLLGSLKKFWPYLLLGWASAGGGGGGGRGGGGQQPPTSPTFTKVFYGGDTTDTQVQDLQRLMWEQIKSVWGRTPNTQAKNVGLLAGAQALQKALPEIAQVGLNYKLQTKQMRQSALENLRNFYLQQLQLANQTEQLRQARQSNALQTALLIFQAMNNQGGTGR